MFLQFEYSRFGETVVPPEWSDFVNKHGETLIVSGDPTALRDIYVWRGRSRVIVTTKLVELLDSLHRLGIDVEVSEFGVSALLHNGLIPVPRTAYRSLSVLSMGDSVVVRPAEGALTYEFGFDYPWLPDRSTNDGEADSETLLKLLTASTERQLAPTNGDAFLMLSSGKDSPAVALALAEGGFTDVRCITYSSGPRDPEPPIAADICRKLGLEHVVVEMTNDPGRTAEVMQRFFARAPVPGTDLSQIPYWFAANEGGSGVGAILDGGGNDAYMGYPVGGHDAFKQRYRIRGRQAARVVARLARVDSKLNYLARSRVEATFPGRTMRHHHIKRLFPDAVDIGDWWYDQSRNSRSLDLFSLFAAYNERYTNAAQTLSKQRLAAAALGIDAVLPWCDRALADYYFNLPQRERYDTRTGKNKLLLRNMLERYLGYDADAVGKHYFEFDGAAFIVHNIDFIRSEIEDADLWKPEGLRMVSNWLEALPSRPMLYHALLTVFMVSGWYNHSRFLHQSTPGKVA